MPLSVEEQAVLDAALAFAASGESYMGPAANKLHWAAKALHDSKKKMAPAANEKRG